MTKLHIIGGIIGMGVVVMTLIWVGQRQSTYQPPSQQTPPVEISQAIRQIHALVQQPVTSSPPKASSPVSQQLVQSLRQEQTQQRQQAAGLSPIAVYEGPVRVTTENNSFRPTGHNALKPTKQRAETAPFMAQMQRQPTIRNSYTLQPETHTYTIKAGAVVPASLLTGINSDLPGHMIAKVRQNVYDTATGHHLLIPQGSTLLGDMTHK